MKQRTLLITIAVAVLALCTLIVGVAAGAGYLYFTTASVSEVTLPPEPAVVTTPPATLTPVQPERPPLTEVDRAGLTETERLLAETEIPERDLRLLAGRLKYNGRELPAVVHETPPVYQLGDEDSFWVVDDTSGNPRQFEAVATLRYVTDHAYWWVEKGARINENGLRRSAETFENETYPTNRNFFGSEWSPGVDNDPRVHIYLGNVPGVGGYFASLHEFSQAVNPYSNEREMFFINLNALPPGNQNFDSVLAHEFQHMIHWYQDRNETTWVNEGLSELATFLNGYDVNRMQNAYLQEPDLQLTTWAHDIQASAPHYGSSYLFMAYFLERFGEDLLKAVVADDGNGEQGFNNALAKAGLALTFDEVFADFVVANYLDDPTLDNGRWGYDSLSNQPPAVDARHERFPIDRQTTVRQYGVDYIDIDSDQPVTIEFEGDTIANVLNNEAYSGRYQWYSNRADDSNATLTRAFDLSGVDQATLNYYTWFDIEEDWDYAYLEVSTDGGKSWTILEPGEDARTTNPSGNAYGPGYTGASPGWVKEAVDLTPYAGHEILLRFEYITDDAVNGPGFALDDLAIPEIGFFDDMEDADPAWEAAGFVRMDNLLQQHFTVQVIHLMDTPTVTRLPLDETNRGQLTVGQPDDEWTRVVLVISAHAPVTTEAANYRYSISVAGK